MSKATAIFPPPTISHWRVKFLAVAFGAPDDNQTIEGIQNPFDRDRCRARIRFERQRRQLNRDYTFKFHGSKNGQLDDIADSVARTEAQRHIAEGFDFIESYAREALRYPALIRGDERLMATLLNPGFENEEGIRS
jgi:hypothetical protein